MSATRRWEIDDEKHASRLRRVVRVAHRRARSSHREYALTRDSKLVKGELTGKAVVELLRDRITAQHPGPIWRIRTPAKVIMVVREVAIDDRRIEMVTNARYLISRAASIHYSQDRPWRKSPLTSFPKTLDCSSSTIYLAWTAGAPDPSHFGFSGYGNTANIVERNRPISRSDVRPGDIVTFGEEHTAVLLTAERDPLLFSHGSEAGPLAVRLSVESRYHSGATVRFFSLT